MKKVLLFVGGFVTGSLAVLGAAMLYTAGLIDNEGFKTFVKENM